MSSFVPVIQIFILTLNGAYLALIEQIIGYNQYDTKTINLIGSLLPILLFLFWFYKATNQVAKIIAASLAIVFITAFVLFMTMDNNLESDPYWLQFIVAALISGGVLSITAYLKYRHTPLVKR